MANGIEDGAVAVGREGFNPPDALLWCLRGDQSFAGGINLEQCSTLLSETEPRAAGLGLLCLAALPWEWFSARKWSR